MEEPVKPGTTFTPRFAAARAVFFLFSAAPSFPPSPNPQNWRAGAAPVPDAVFAEAFRALKPGGTLGVVEHRLPEDADAAREKESGYVKVSTVKALAEKAGFRFVEASEINANPKDTRDHPEGVWTLPPSLRLKDVDKAKYLAIGESDRMTLKFVKPE